MAVGGPGAGASYVPIARKWKAGDCIDIDFPMSLWAKPLPGSDRYVAFFYGPLLLAADYGTAGRSPRQRRQTLHVRRTFKLIAVRAGETMV